VTQDLYRLSAQSRFAIHQRPDGLTWLSRQDGALWATYNVSLRKLLDIEVAGTAAQSQTHNGAHSSTTGLYATAGDSIRYYTGAGRRVHQEKKKSLPPLLIYDAQRQQTWVGVAEGRQLHWSIYR